MTDYLNIYQDTLNLKMDIGYGAWQRQIFMLDCAQTWCE